MLPNSNQQNPYTNHILVCAPSNAAVDELVRRARRGVYAISGAKFVPKMVRLGTTDGVSERVKELTLDHLVDTAITDDQELITNLKSRNQPSVDAMLQKLDHIKKELKAKYIALGLDEENGRLENEIRELNASRKDLMEQFTNECQSKDASRRMLDTIKAGLRGKLLVGSSLACELFIAVERSKHRSVHVVHQRARIADSGSNSWFRHRDHR